MIYMLQVYTLVAVSVFGLAGAFILALFIWTEAKDYAVARRAMRRAAPPVFREPVTISRNASRNRKTHFNQPRVDTAA